MNISSLSSVAISGASRNASGASSPMAPSKKMSKLFDQINSSDSGTISQSQFQKAFESLNPAPSFQAAGASAIWSNLDPIGTGSVSKQDFVSRMTAMMKQLNSGAGVQNSSPAGTQELIQGINALTGLGGSGTVLDVRTRLALLPTALYLMRWGRSAPSIFTQTISKWPARLKQKSTELNPAIPVIARTAY